MYILVTGGAGFIGSTLIKYIIQNTDHNVINLDKLTYAGNLNSLQRISLNSRYQFEHADTCNSEELKRIFSLYPIDAVMNLAAETHVDRSIDGPAAFIQTNVIGTYNLLQASRHYYDSLGGNKPFRFHHISTDEVYGDLTEECDPFTEETPYKPNSPYSASKAASDHLVRAWYRTYKLPIIITNTSNNYGPYQFPEKLIPHVIINALQGRSLPVYGDGQQIRDWIHVDDHVRALYEVLINGKIGQTYNIGGQNEIKNLDVVEEICDLLDRLRPKAESYRKQIDFVPDRPGHDRRYAISNWKIYRDLGWRPSWEFKDGLRQTVEWYLGNEKWWNDILNGKHLERIGTGK